MIDKKDMEQLLKGHLEIFKLQHDLNKVKGNNPEDILDLMTEAELFRSMLWNIIKENSKFIMKERDLLAKKGITFKKGHMFFESGYSAVDFSSSLGEALEAKNFELNNKTNNNK